MPGPRLPERRGVRWGGPPRGDDPPLSATPDLSRLPVEEVDAALAGAGSPWERRGDELVLEHRAADFAGALAWVQQVAALAEAADHHPDIDIRYNRVVLHLTTHSAGGLTALDLDLAAQVAALDDR